MRLVIIESPYAGEVETNVKYARAAVRDSLLRGEAPIASHLLYTQPGILDDLIPEERQHGIDAGLAWRSVAEASVVYTDRGITRGMEYGIKAAEAAGKPVEYRSLPRCGVSDKENEMDEIEMLARMWVECDPNRGGTSPDDPIATDGQGTMDGQPTWHWFRPRAEASAEYFKAHGFKLVKADG